MKSKSWRSRLLMALVSISLPLANGFAQGPGTARNTGAVHYLISLPTAGTDDFIDNISFRGGSLEWLNFGERRAGVGLSFRWIYFYEENDNESYTSGNVTLTGRQTRSIDVLPLFVEGRYRIPFAGKLAPYVGLAAGGIYGQRRHQVGAYGLDEETGWQFGFAGEAGLECCSFGEWNNVGIGLRYDAGLGTDDLDAISFFSLKLGLVFNI